VRNALSTFAALALVTCCSGCLTFGRGLIGTHQSVTFVSEPEGADVEIHDMDCVTPCALDLSPTDDHTVALKKSGYESELVRLHSKHGWAGAGMSFAANTAVWGWWTLGIGTAAGMIVDLFSGSMKSLDLPDDETIHVQLTPIARPDVAAGVPPSTDSIVGASEADLDGDGIRIPADSCPGTSHGATVDSVGCSLPQFCAAVNATSPLGQETCAALDWMNDEPLGQPGDCSPDRATGRCVPN
jgi:hypothetical protein